MDILAAGLVIYFQLEVIKLKFWHLAFHCTLHFFLFADAIDQRVECQTVIGGLMLLY